MQQVEPGQAPSARQSFLHCVIALTGVALAVGLRVLANPILGHESPYITVAPALMLIAVSMSYLPSLLAVVAGIAAVEFGIVGNIRGVPPAAELAIRIPILLACTLFICHLAQRLRISEARSKREAHAVMRAARQAEEVLESITDAFIALDPQGKVLYANAQFEKVTPFKISQVLGRILWDVAPQAVGTPFELNFRKAIAQQISVHYEEFFAPFNTWYEIHAYPSAFGLSVYARDITERRQTRQRLEEISAFNQSLLDSLPSHVAVLDEKGCIVAVNEPWRRFALENGVLDEASIGVGANYIEACSKASQFDDPLARDAMDGIVAVIQGRKERFELEYPCHTPQLRQWFLLLVVRPPGGQRGAILSHIDISTLKLAEEAQRRSEQRYRNLVELSPDAVLIYRDSRIIFVNDASLGLLGAFARDQIVGKTPYDLAHPDHHDAIRSRIALQLRGEKLAMSEEKIIRLDGSVRDVEVTAAPFDEPEGPALQIILRDITSRKIIENELRAASAAKDQFLAALSHELRTPMTPVLAAATALRSDPRLPADVQDDLAMIARNIALEKRLIDDLLDLTRIAQGKIEMISHNVDAAAILRDAASIVSSNLDARNQTLTIQTPGAPYIMFADAARLQQVFWNILRNASKFSPDCGKIDVLAQVVSLPPGAHGDQRWLRIAITDNGVGIASDFLNKVFIPFEQADTEITRQFGGLGLGMAITKALVEIHGGRIAVHSDGPGKGSTFTLELPLAPAGAPLASAPLTSDPTTTASPLPATSDLHRLRILLVEDHPDTLKIMRRLLLAEAHSVHTASSVRAALDLAAAQDFDLLITDLGLPDGTGHDLLRNLQQMGKPLSAIAVSGYGMAADVQRSLAIGFVEHVTKPVSFNGLRAAVIRAAAKIHPPTPAPC